MRIAARSISLRAAAALRSGVTGRVLASFERVCDLVTDDGAVVALVWAGVGDGPLNVVLEHEPGVALPADTRFVVSAVVRLFAGVAPSTASSGQPAHLFAPGAAPKPFLELDLAPAARWEARPDWARLRACREQIPANAQIVAHILAERGISLATCGLPAAECDVLSQYPIPDARSPIRDALRAVIGRGPGLTPAGDDWLAGWLLAARLTHGAVDHPPSVPPPPQEDGKRELGSIADLVHAAANRTTTLSRAFLACAAAGEADEHWHRLLAALAAEPTHSLQIYQSTAAILSHGATSGAAMLLGFMAGLLTPR